MIHTLTFDNPGQGNSLGLKEAQQLEDLLHVLKTKKAKGLVVQSTGSRFFCTGGNLEEQRTAKTKQESLRTQKRIRNSLQKLTEMDLVSVAVVNGDAFGGGMELLSAFDYVIASPHSYFGLWQGRLGVTFGWGGLRLQRRLDPAKLNQLLLSTRVFSAYEAFSLGIIDEIVPEFKLSERAYEWLACVLDKNKTSPMVIRNLNLKNQTRVFEKLWMNKNHRGIL